MKARHYKPFIQRIKDMPLVVYPVKDENPLQDVYNSHEHTSIQDHIHSLYLSNTDLLSQGSYHIVFIWNLEGHRMTDVWTHDMKNWSDSGPLLNCYTFRDLEPCNDAGIASGDSIIVLGREEELRRSVSRLEEYLDRDKYTVQFPEGMQPEESFYV